VAQLRIRNSGPGYIDKLEPGSLAIEQQDKSGSTFSCMFDSTIYPANGIFPPISCVFTAPREINVAAAYPITFNITYSYELRQSVPVMILKP